MSLTTSHAALIDTARAIAGDERAFRIFQDGILGLTVDRFTTLLESLGHLEDDRIDITPELLDDLLQA